MSSEDDTLDGLPAAPVKKRRIQRACDICRQKRRACDGLRTTTKKCTFCSENGLDCVYSGAATTTKRKSYTEVLEGKLAETEKLLRKFTTHITTNKPEWSTDSPILQHPSLPSSSSTVRPRPGLAVEFAAMTIRAVNAEENLEDSDDSDAEHVQLARDLNALKISGHREQFMGKSSGAMLVKVAMDLKDAYSSPAPSASLRSPVSRSQRMNETWNTRRMEYWTSTPWRHAGLARPRYVFPPADVLSDLVDLYFTHTNAYVPLLHRPTFLHLLKSSEHLRDDKFGAIVLIVCAIASRFSNDPRVVDGDGTTTNLACGWKYFSQLSTELEHMFDTPGLYDLQRYCLAVQFLEGSATQATWPLIGIGLRIAEEVGAHRRQVAGIGAPGSAGASSGPHAHSDTAAQGMGFNARTLPGHTVEAELWRRAFWTLVYYDRMVSCTLGRPCGVQWDDFDIQLPTACDDEYWEMSDPARSFRQPPGQPSTIAFFNAMLKLNNILSFVLRLLYSIDKKSGLMRRDDERWEDHIVAELDSALNKWVDSIPEHLRWDPNRADPLFFKQSVALYCAYYHVQMTIHRPFIPMMRRGGMPTGLPSLAICTNAARSCAHVADVWCRRTKGQPAIILLPALTVAGVVLLLNVWSTKRTGLAPHMNTTIDEVHKIMEAIRACESRWQMAGLFWDILHELANVGHVPLHAAGSGTSQQPPAQDHSSPESTGGGSSGSGSATAYSQSSTSSPSGRQAATTGAVPTSFPTGTANPNPTPPVTTSGSRLKRTHSHQPRGTDPAADLVQAAIPADAAWADPLVNPGGGTLGLWADEPFAWLGAPDQAEFLPMYSSDLGRATAYEMQSQQPFQSTTSAMWAGGTAPVSLFTGGAAAQAEPDLLGTLDMSMWANAPPGLGANDWDTYFSLMNEMDR
ncbi:fungal-specific transcription factor domain-containing protein [Mycena amicta]|nr:fungal-specific transcription factor domain-containing protein [Mycena amicta]